MSIVYREISPGEDTLILESVEKKTNNSYNYYKQPILWYTTGLYSLKAGQDLWDTILGYFGDSFTINAYIKNFREIGVDGECGYKFNQSVEEDTHFTTVPLAIYANKENLVYWRGLNYYESVKVRFPSIDTSKWHFYSLVKNGRTISFYVNNKLTATLPNIAPEFRGSVIGSPVYTSAWISGTFDHLYIDKVSNTNVPALVKILEVIDVSGTWEVDNNEYISSLLRRSDPESIATISKSKGSVLLLDFEKLEIMPGQLILGYQFTVALSIYGETIYYPALFKIKDNLANLNGIIECVCFGSNMPSINRVGFRYNCTLQEINSLRVAITNLSDYTLAIYHAYLEVLVTTVPYNALADITENNMLVDITEE